MFHMFDLVNASLKKMTTVLEIPNHISENDFMEACNLEHEINNYRDLMKSQNTVNITEHQYDYIVGVSYMDIISECEKMGDYIINVEEAISDKKCDKQ